MPEPAVILADRASEAFSYTGLGDALATPGGAVDLRVFAKPTTRPYRRMGVTLVRADTTDAARTIAKDAADKVRIIYRD